MRFWTETTVEVTRDIWRYCKQQAKRKGEQYQPNAQKEMRWSYYSQLMGEETLSLLSGRHPQYCQSGIQVLKVL